MKAYFRVACGICVALSLSACESAHYYAQAVGGHWRLLQSRVAIDAAITDPVTPPELVRKLETVRAARRFASDTLLLPDNDSYTQYAPMQRDAVTYNVVAAPEFSLTPKTWCFPFAGCVNYRGYFDPADARKKAEQLAATGHDTVITHAAAYSTLGWFADPLPGPVLRWDSDRVVGLLFHELAHQKLYIRDDTTFNESYASAVAVLGLEAWQATESASVRSRITARRRMHALLVPTTEALRRLYQQDLPSAEKRSRKAALFADAQARYAHVAAELPGWEDWIAGLNNARLASLSDYTRGIAVFETLFSKCEQDWACFHRESRRLGEDDERRGPLFSVADSPT